MPTAAVEALKQHIAHLEEELARHRRALAILEEGEAKEVTEVRKEEKPSLPLRTRVLSLLEERGRPLAPREMREVLSVSSDSLSSLLAKMKKRGEVAHGPQGYGLPGKEIKQAPSPPAGKGPQKSARVLIQDFLTASAPRMFAPQEIVEGLSRRGHMVTLQSAHSRLSELVKAKVVRREDGRYGAAGRGSKIRGKAKTRK